MEGRLCLLLQDAKQQTQKIKKILTSKRNKQGVLQHLTDAEFEEEVLNVVGITSFVLPGRKTRAGIRDANTPLARCDTHANTPLAICDANDLQLVVPNDLQLVEPNDLQLVEQTPKKVVDSNAAPLVDKVGFCSQWTITTRRILFTMVFPLLHNGR